MVHKCVWVGVLLVAVLLSTVPALSVAAPRLLPPAQAAPNLQNPGFEGISCRAGSVSPQCLDNWTRDTLDGSQPSNVFTPQGWVAWWRTGSGYGGPSVEVIPKEPPFTGERLRIHGGYYATRLFISWNIMDAGLLQTVSGLTPGATVQLSAYGHTWACTSLSGDSGAASSCGGDNMSMQVGIDPNGARDFNSPSIVWSPENPARDSFVVIGPATAQVGTGESVTVFLRGKSK